MKEKNIRELAKRMGLITVEDMCQYTIAQLVVMVANKVNELVDEVWRFETDVQETVKTQNENIQYLLGEGLHLEVENIFDGWIQDGTFDALINQTALRKVNERIDETNERIDETNAQLSQIFPQLEEMVVVFANEGEDITPKILLALEKTNHVKIGKGNYKMSTLTLPRSNITLDMEKGGNVLLQGMRGIYCNNKSNITIKNLNINGNGILDPNNHENGNSALYLENSDNLLVENCSIYNTGAWGVVVLSGCDNITIRNNKCSGSIRQSGIAISGNCTNFTIDNNYCENNRYSGIIVEPHCRYGVISNNKCLNNIENNIILVDNENCSIIVDNNICTASKSNITLIRNQKVTVTNNNIIGGTLGVQVEKTNILNVKNNMITDCDSMGISILSGDNQPKLVDVVVDGNNVINCTLTDSREHVGNYFIRDCVNLIFTDNTSSNSKTRDYSLSSNTIYKLKLIPSCNKSPQTSLLSPEIKSHKLSVLLNKEKQSETLKMPYDVEVFAIKIKKTVLTNNDGFVQIKLNDQAITSFGSETDSKGKTLMLTRKYNNRFTADGLVKISYAHSLNFDYVKDVEIELLYF